MAQAGSGRVRQAGVQQGRAVLYSLAFDVRDDLTAKIILLPIHAEKFAKMARKWNRGISCAVWKSALERPIKVPEAAELYEAATHRQTQLIEIVLKSLRPKGGVRDVR